MALTKNFIKIFGFIIVLLFVPIVSWAACTGSSPNWACDTDNTTSAQVQACVDSATAGDTITFDAGTGTWTGQVAIGKSITLIGAGIGTTIINSTHSGYGSSTTDSAWAGLLVVPDTPSDNPIIRVSGFTFNFTNNHGIIYGNSSTSYDLTNVRFDHLKISAKTWVFQRNGMAHGVMDNCQIKGYLGTSGPDLWSANNAAAAYEFGDESVFYFEDNTWTAYSNSHNMVQSGNGPSRYVFRYNDIILPSAYEAVSPLWDQHQGCFGAEIYGNEIIIPNNAWWFSDQRGGKWLFFNNNVIWDQAVAIRIRQESSNYSTQSYSGQPQRITNSYYWGNLRNNSTVIDAAASGEVTYHSSLGRHVPLENYDYWNYNKSFDGTSGMGAGTLSNRPTTCTTGVGYWATDQSITDLTGMVGANPATPISGTLYTCGNSNNWVQYYTPYTYPHPLRVGTTSPPSGVDTNPSPPSNLRIIP